MIWEYLTKKKDLFTPGLQEQLGQPVFSRIGVKLHTGARHHVMVYPMFIWHISARSHSATDSTMIQGVFVKGTLFKLLDEALI